MLYLKNKRHYRKDEAVQSSKNIRLIKQITVQFSGWGGYFALRPNLYPELKATKTRVTKAEKFKYVHNVVFFLGIVYPLVIPF